MEREARVEDHDRPGAGRDLGRRRDRLGASAPASAAPRSAAGRRRPGRCRLAKPSSRSSAPSSSKTCAQAGERHRRREDPGAAAGRLLGALRVRRAVGAEEEARIAAGRGPTQRQPVPLALDDRQAVVVRPDAADEQVVAVQDQVVDGDRRRRRSPRASTKATPSAVVTCSSTMRSSGSARAERRQHPLDEDRLAVEDVDLGVGHLAVHAERQADRRHPLQHRHHPRRCRARRSPSWWSPRPDRA